jgi:two-component system OmpR family sensor kinase
MALLLAGLVVAQTVTLALTVLLPPAPAMHHTLADIAAGLRGALPDSDADRPLVRTVETQPPSLQSPGWVASEPASADLARLLNAPREDVRLLFYAPPPFAGAESRRPGRPPLALLFTTYAEAQTLPPGPGPGGVGGLRGGMSDRAASSRQGFPAGAAMRAAGGQRVFRSDAAGSPNTAGGINGGSGSSATRRPRAEAGRSTDPLFAAPFRSRTMTLPDSLRGSPTPSSPPLDPVADAAAREPTLKAPPPPQPLAPTAPVTEPVQAAPHVALPAPQRPASPKPAPEATSGRPLPAPGDPQPVRPGPAAVHRGRLRGRPARGSRPVGDPAAPARGLPQQLAAPGADVVRPVSGRGGAAGLDLRPPPGRAPGRLRRRRRAAGPRPGLAGLGLSSPTVPPRSAAPPGPSTPCRAG